MNVINSNAEKAQENHSQVSNQPTQNTCNIKLKKVSKNVLTVYQNEFIYRYKENKKLFKKIEQREQEFMEKMKNRKPYYKQIVYGAWIGWRHQQ